MLSIGSRTSAILAPVVVGVAAIVARLPFLLRGDRFFDSDEAVEGLMARHVLQGELPLFLWGQRYKGVPEVYLTSAVFGAMPGTSASVIVLKAVTLVCFALFVALNFVLLARVCSRRTAWLGSLFLVACSPALVLWSMSASAEIVLTMLLGTVVYLGVERWRRQGSRRGLVFASAAFGLGLWIQQFIVYYVIAFALAYVIETPDWRAQLADGFESRPVWMRRLVQVIVVAAGVYVAIGLVTFLAGGVQIAPAGIRLTSTSPQKPWWTAAGLLVVAFVAGAIRFRREYFSPAVAFLIGFAPAIVGRFVSQGSGAPMGNMDLAGLREVLPIMTTYGVPILAGFRSPTVGRLDVSAWWAVALGIVLVASYVEIRRRPYPRFFHVFLLVTPVVFVASGAFIDAQSYRYLMPVLAALPVVCAVGIEGAIRANRIFGGVLLGALVTFFVGSQVAWYRELTPDRQSRAIIDCLDEAGHDTAFADYWVSYKVMFLTAERLTLAPTNGLDRYPAFTERVNARRPAPVVVAPPPGTAETASCQAIVQ